jgi:hypothetical protein
MNDFQKVLLTDFNKPRWSGIKINSVIFCLTDVIERANQNRLIGEYNLDLEMIRDQAVINLMSVSHRIANIQFIDNCVYGDIYFLSHPLGKTAKQSYENEIHVFSIRSMGIDDEKGITLDKIITWDLVLKQK